jgi:tRNA modification GTPase
VFSHDVPALASDGMTHAVVIPVMTKADVHGLRPAGANVVSGITGAGLPSLLDAIAAVLRENFGGEPALVSRERQRVALESCVHSLERAGSAREAELIAEDLRLAQTALARLLGHVDVESVLDRLFAGFCIGK